MDPTTTFCPNVACPARGQTGQGNIGIHSCKDKRFICTECHKTFSATQGTAFYRLRTSAETVSLVVTLLAHGCPLQAIVVAVGYDERTVAGWVARAGDQGQAVQEHLVEQPRDLGQVQADEIRVKKQGGIVWMALAMMIKTRLWLGGEVSEQRDMPLIRRLIERVRRCAAHHPLLVCTDGLVSYIRAMRETFRDPIHTGTGGRPRLRPWRHVLIAQVVNRYERRRVVETERRIVDGTPARVETLRRRSQGDGVINQYGLHRTAQRDLPGAPGVADPSRPSARTPHADAATRDVSDWYSLQLLYAACESAPRRPWGRRAVSAQDTGYGRRDHGSLLECARTVVVSRAAASLDATQATWASLACAQTSHGAVVRGPRLAVELPLSLKAIGVTISTFVTLPDKLSVAQR